MTTHDDYPQAPIPEVSFTGQQTQYLDSFTYELLRAGNYANDDPYQGQQNIEQMVDAGVADALSAPGAESLKLAVVAEALGATRVQGKAVSLLELIQSSPLLDEQDRQMLGILSNNAWAYRMQSGSEEQTAAATVQQISSDLMHINRLEREGVGKPALKIAMLAYGAGATLRQPEYRAGEQLLAEVHKFSTPQQ